jgi:hypothetical protein
MVLDFWLNWNLELLIFALMKDWILFWFLCVKISMSAHWKHTNVIRHASISEAVISVAVSLVMNWKRMVEPAEVCTYLFLTECEVRTESYGSSFFHCLMAQARRARTMKKRKNWGSITYLTVQTDQTRLIRCLLYGSFSTMVNTIEKRFSPYGKLRTANWPIVDHKITLTYNNLIYVLWHVFKKSYKIRS